MRRAKLSQFNGGWFLGGFKPSLLPTKQFEVGFKRHQAGAVWPEHYQRVAVEYNLLVRGRMRIGRHIFNDGDVFVIPPGEAVKPIFITDCEVVVVKVPSLPGNKVEC
jgi:quercetin dioxygenase-like cupin family protein